MNTEEHIGSEDSGGILEFKLEKSKDYYLKDKDQSIVDLKANRSDLTSVTIENCNISELRLSNIHSVTIKNTTVSTLIKATMVKFTGINNLEVEGLKINSECDLEDEDSSLTGMSVRRCSEANFSDLEFTGTFKFCIATYMSDVTIRDSSFYDSEWFISPNDDSKLKLYDLEFEEIRREMIKNDSGEYSIIDLDNCPEILLEKL